MKEKEKMLDKKISNLMSKKITKKRSLQEKGITLIALVVTIIILLILAGVTLNIALSDGGLFSKTQEAADKYKQAQSDEEDLILKYEFEMAKLQGEISETETVEEYAMEKEIKEKYGQNIKIGDTVNYDPNVDEGKYEGTWKVLGIEDGKILLMSSKPIEDDFEIIGLEGYITLIESLDELCSEFGEGVGAEGARSLRVEDINRITGYSPDGNEIYGKGKMREYGTEVTLTRNEKGTIDVESSNGQHLTWNVETFKYVSEDGEIEEFKDKLVIKNNLYEYETDTVKNWYADMGRATRDFTGHWQSLFDSYGEKGIWLADRVTGVSETFFEGYGHIRYQCRLLAKKSWGFKYVAVNFLWDDEIKDDSIPKSHEVACVVSLKPSVNFERGEGNTWNIVNNS